MSTRFRPDWADRFSRYPAVRRAWATHRTWRAETRRGRRRKLLRRMRSALRGEGR